MEKIKLSLWDIFVFISSGIVLHLAVVLNELYIAKSGYLNVENLGMKWLDGNELSVIFVLLIYFLLFGKILEPVANETYSLFNNILKTISMKFKKDKGDNQNEKLRCLVVKKIKEEFKIDVEGSPYHFVKDYLTDCGRNGLFLVFLSRYGFYRNCFFVCLLLIIRNIINMSSLSLLMIAPFGILLVLYYKRTSQFFSFQEPTLYRTFLMHK